MTEENIFSQTDPMRRPLLGIVLCYLAGTLGGVWIAGLHFITVLAFTLLALGAVFGLDCISRLHQSKSRHRNFKDAAGPEALALPMMIDSGKGRAAASLPRRPNLDIIPPYQETIFIFRFLPGLAVCFIYIAVFLAGGVAINLCLNSPSGRDISALMDRPREGVEIIGVVADDPALRKNWRGDYQYWSFAMKVEAVCRTGVFQKAWGEVLVSMPTNAVAKNPHYGEHWQLCGVLIDKACLANTSGLDAINSRLPYRFAFQVSDQSSPDLMAEPSPWDLFHWCFILRQKCADILARGIAHRPDVAGILQALLLGRRYELPDGLRAAFVATGTYHIFAISGQHVAIIAMFVVVVLQESGICRLNWFYYLAPALIIFTIMTGMSASAMRGCIMALMCFLGPMFKRKTDISSAMALAALLIVGADPLQLFQAGFILSFGIVAGLIVLCPPLIAMVERKIISDPCQIEPENWPARGARKIIRWILFMLIASFAACLVSTPLIAYWFNLVSPIALPANLIVIPMATLVLLTGCLSIISGLFCPFAAEVFNFANVAFVSLTTGVTKALAQAPFGHVFIRSPPIWFVCLWLGVLVVGRIYYQKTKIWLAAVLILLIAGVLMWRSQRNEWEVHVFNIDQCAVGIVNKAGSNPLLLNTGPRYQAHRVLRYLHKIGVNRIQTLVCPFPDAKHIGGAKDIIAALPVSRIWRGVKKPRAGFMKELYSEAENRRIGVGELTNEIWRVRSGRNGWSIDVFNDRDGVVQNKKEDLSAGCSAGPLTIFINAGIQTQTTARILIGNEQTPLVIDIEEVPISGFRNSAVFSMPSEAYCRILCCPTAEERTQSYCAQSSDLHPPARITLGPGQGVLLLPGKEEKIRAIDSDLSANGR